MFLIWFLSILGGQMRMQKNLRPIRSNTNFSQSDSGEGVDLAGGGVAFVERAEFFVVI